MTLRIPRLSTEKYLILPLCVAGGLMMGYDYLNGIPIPDLVGSSWPRKCSEITPEQINGALQNAPLARLLGTEVLEVISTRDTGSADRYHLSCSVNVMTNTDADETQRILVSTKVVNGRSYIVLNGG